MYFTFFGDDSFSRVISVSDMFPTTFLKREDSSISLYSIVCVVRLVLSSEIFSVSMEESLPLVVEDERCPRTGYFRASVHRTQDDNTNYELIKWRLQ